MELLFKSQKGADKRLTINFEEDVIETKYFIADENVVESSSADDDETGQMSFIAFRIRKTSDNGLMSFKNTYKPDDENSGEKKYVVVEFRSDVDCRQFIESVPPDLAPFFDKTKLTPYLQVGRYSKILVTDSKQERRRSRRSPRSSKREGFLAGMGDDDKLLIYPFPADKAKLEEAADGLLELSGTSPPREAGPESSDTNGNADDEEPSSRQNSNPREENVVAMPSRAHYLTVRVGDFDRLESGEFLHDTLIDFFLQWYVSWRNNGFLFLSRFANLFLLCAQDDSKRRPQRHSRLFVSLLHNSRRGRTQKCGQVDEEQED